MERGYEEGWEEPGSVFSPRFHLCTHYGFLQAVVSQLCLSTAGTCSERGEDSSSFTATLGECRVCGEGRLELPQNPTWVGVCLVCKAPAQPEVLWQRYCLLRRVEQRAAVCGRRRRRGRWAELTKCFRFSASVSGGACTPRAPRAPQDSLRTLILRYRAEQRGGGGGCERLP